MWKTRSVLDRSIYISIHTGKIGFSSEKWRGNSIQSEGLYEVEVNFYLQGGGNDST
jgi:hypothetical protein